jgi:hypothetical protein
MMIRTTKQDKEIERIKKLFEDVEKDYADLRNYFIEQDSSEEFILRYNDWKENLEDAMWERDVIDAECKGRREALSDLKKEIEQLVKPTLNMSREQQFSEKAIILDLIYNMLCNSSEQNRLDNRNLPEERTSSSVSGEHNTGEDNKSGLSQDKRTQSSPVQNTERTSESVVDSAEGEGTLSPSGIIQKKCTCPVHTFDCPCGKDGTKFSKRQDLNKHIIAEHTNKPFCGRCGGAL